MSGDFRQRLHAGYNTPEHVVFELAERASGQAPTARQKIVRGYDSEVYRITTRGGADFVVRIHHRGGADFANEAWAIEQCRRAGVPAPEVLLVEHLLVDGQPREVMVQRAVPGRPLCEIHAALSRDQLAEIWRQIGAALGAIHSVRAGGFYKRHPDGSWDFPDWASIMRSAIHDRTAEKPLLLAAGLAESEVDRMLALLEYQRDHSAGEPPVLCHGDLAPEHLFVGGDLNLSGVIDFGEFQGGSPLVDFANLSMNCPDLDLAWLRRGYANQALFENDFARRLLLAKIGMQMGYLAHYIRQGNAEEAGPIREQLRATLRGWEEQAWTSA
jgi:aminoglycoside phosphotransferase (APT) family kinase protein